LEIEIILKKMDDNCSRLKDMSRKYLFALIFVVEYLLSSCNGTKNKINDENEMQFKKNYKKEKKPTV